MSRETSRFAGKTPGGDMTQMEDNALNKDHSKTTSMPNHMAELGSGNFAQELALSLLGSENDTLDQIEAAIERIEDGIRPFIATKRVVNRQRGIESRLRLVDRRNGDRWIVDRPARAGGRDTRERPHDLRVGQSDTDRFV